MVSCNTKRGENLKLVRIYELKTEIFLSFMQLIPNILEKYHWKATGIPSL